MAFDALNRPITISDLPYTYDEKCPVSIEELILVRFIHMDLTGKEKVGEIVLNRVISNAFIEVMKIAYDINYPLHQAVVLDNPKIKGKHQYSMQANNTAGFSCRNESGSREEFSYSSGLALDINPLMNPALNPEGIWVPRNSNSYIDRSVIQTGMLNETHDITLAFLERGFNWGGLWELPNYHYFEFSDTSL